MVIAFAVGEPIRVPYLKLYDDGYYRPKEPRRPRAVPHGFGLRPSRLAMSLTFRPHISQWSGSGSRLDSPRFPGATARETVRTLRVQGERRRLMASLSTGRGGTSGEGSSRAMMAGMRRPFSCTIATLPFGQTLPGNAMNNGAVAALAHGTDFGSAPLGRPDGTGSEDMENCCCVRRRPRLISASDA